MGLILLILSILSPLLPIITGKHNRKEPLWMYSFLCFTTDLTELVLKEEFHFNLTEIAHITLLIEIVSFYYYFYKRSVIPTRIAFWIITSIAVIFYILHTLFSISWHQLNTGGYSVVLMSYILLSMLGFRNILHNQRTKYIGTSAFFWGNTAIMVYACGAFFIFLFKDKVYSVNAELFGQLWIYGYLTFYITKNLLLGVALAKNRTVE
jgi:hypothetical protein